MLTTANLSVWLPLSVYVCEYVCLFLVYADGRVCISILHAPGDDPMGYESSSERWSPVQSVEKILLSVVSMLAGKFLLLSVRASHQTVSISFLANDRCLWDYKVVVAHCWSALIRVVLFETEEF